MNLVAKWHGNSHPEDTSGTGVFQLGDKRVEIEFKCFADYHEIHQMMEALYLDGRKELAETLEYLVVNTIRKAT